LHFPDTVFHKLEVCGNPASIKCIGTNFPTALFLNEGTYILFQTYCCCTLNWLQYNVTFMHRETKKLVWLRLSRWSSLYQDGLLTESTIPLREVYLKWIFKLGDSRNAHSCEKYEAQNSYKLCTQTLQIWLEDVRYLHRNGDLVKEWVLPPLCKQTPDMMEDYQLQLESQDGSGANPNLLGSRTGGLRWQPNPALSHVSNQFFCLPDSIWVICILFWFNLFASC